MNMLEYTSKMNKLDKEIDTCRFIIAMRKKKIDRLHRDKENLTRNYNRGK